MKPLTAILLSIILFGASFQNSLFIIDYAVNRDFYEIHCINKANPEMDCHGKCQVQQESEKNTNPFHLVKYSFEFNILPSAPVPDFTCKQDSAIFHSKDFGFKESFFDTIFLNIPAHPPQV